MRETEETYTIPALTLEEQNLALTREVQHVTEQLRVEHVQIAYWKARAEVAEQALDKLQHGKKGKGN